MMAVGQAYRTMGKAKSDIGAAEAAAQQAKMDHEAKMAQAKMDHEVKMRQLDLENQLRVEQAKSAAAQATMMAVRRRRPKFYCRMQIHNSTSSSPSVSARLLTPSVP